MKIRHINRPINNEEGSVTLLVALLLPIMVTLLILVIDISDLILQRIRLQTTVDACALAAAARQSTGLNEIADLNYAAELEFRKAFHYLPAITWVNRSNGRRAYRFHERCLYYVNEYRKLANKFFAWDAKRYALSVKNHTMPEATLIDELEGTEYPNKKLILPVIRDKRIIPWTYYAMSCRHCINLVAYYSGLPEVSAMHVGPHRTSLPFVARRTLPLPDYGAFNVLWEKDRSQMTYVLYRLEQSAKPLLLGNKLFDLTQVSLLPAVPQIYRQYINRFRMSLQVPKITAYAAAKPTGGYICKNTPTYFTPLSNFKPNYEPILVQLRRVPKQVSFGSLMEH